MPRATSLKAKSFAKRMGFKVAKIPKSVAKQKQERDVKALVKREIDKSQEHKFQTFSATVNLSNFASGTAGLRQANTIPLTPYTSYLTIAQGVTEATRVGNRVRVKKATLNCVFYPRPYDVGDNATPQPQTVVVYIYKMKGIAQGLSTAQAAVDQSSGFGNFFNLGASNAGNVGLYEDLNRTPNDEVYEIMQKLTIKVGASSYSLNTGAQDNYFNYTNNDFSLAKFMELDITKFVPKTLIWEDTSATATSRATFLTCSCVPMDGTGIATTDETPTVFRYALSYEFYDA